MVKRFTKEQAEAAKMWREAHLVTLTEAQIEALDKEITAHGGLGSKHKLNAFLVKKGAAVWQGGNYKGEIAVRPQKYEALMHQLDQRSKWRERKFPFDQRIAYEKMAEAQGILKKKTEI